ncbi:MAG: cytosine permease [Acidobacteria bacterium]|nr:cytosine permease [Acidobacteriota bacterium]
MQAANIGPVGADARTQSPFDLFLIFAGANIVATTLQVGASLTPSFGLSAALVLIAAGSVAGSGLVASLAPLGPRLGVPSVIAARAALGTRGAGLMALFLYLTNFAWIAVNNVIAASACSTVAGGPGSERLWAVGLGVLATAIVAGGPTLVGRADRVAVPLLLVTGIGLTVACLRIPGDVLARPGTGSASWIRGLDIVIAYQVSWILMFADYSRYTRSATRGAAAVFLGLALTSLWFMPLGFLAARAAGSTDPGAMLKAVGLGPVGAVLLSLATLTTNFVNIYLSSLAVKSLRPRTNEQVSVWSTGLVGAALSLLSAAWLEQYASFMLIVGGTLVPVGGVLLAHFFVLRRPVDVASLYAPAGPCGRHGGFSIAGLAAWAAGGLTYFAASGIGGTLPALAVSMAVYVGVAEITKPRLGLGPAGPP